MEGSYWLYGETNIAYDSEFAGRYFGDLIFTSGDLLYTILSMTVHMHSLLPIGNCDSRWLQHKSNHFQQHSLESLAVLGQMLVQVWH